MIVEYIVKICSTYATMQVPKLWLTIIFNVKHT